MTDDERMYRVYKLGTGIVIDHIPARRALQVAEVLGLTQDQNNVLAIGINLDSKKLGRKDVIKIENISLDEQACHRIALVAPTATINILKNHAVLKKFKVELPKEILGLLICPTHNCITNHQPIQTKFYYSASQVRCHYCERKYPLGSVKLKL